MNTFNFKHSLIESLHASSVLEATRRKIDDSCQVPEMQKEIFFNTICEGLLRTWNSSPEHCIEALQSINKFAVNFGMPQTVFSEPIAQVIIELLKINNLKIVKNAMAVVVNAFSQESQNQIEINLINMKIVEIIHDVLLRWGECVFIDILYAITNIVASSKQYRDLILISFKSNELEVLISSTAKIQKYKDKCKAFLKKLCYYNLSNELAIYVFNLLCNLKKYTGNWIFEEMGICFKWINDSSSINPSLIQDAFQVLLSSDNEEIRSALIFIGYTTATINERIVQLLSDDRGEISALAVWTITKYILSKGREAVQNCFNFNILQMIQLSFYNGGYKKRIESAYCLCVILQYATFTESKYILELGLFNDLAEILCNNIDNELTFNIINAFIIISQLLVQSNDQSIGEIIQIIDDHDLYNYALEKKDSRNKNLAQASTELLNILDKIL